MKKIFYYFCIILSIIIIFCSAAVILIYEYDIGGYKSRTENIIKYQGAIENVILDKQLLENPVKAPMYQPETNRESIYTS